MLIILVYLKYYLLYMFINILILLAKNGKIEKMLDNLQHIKLVKQLRGGLKNGF